MASVALKGDDKMPQNDILQFAIQPVLGQNGNLLTQEEYLNDVQRLTGNVPGLARCELVNKVLRQCALLAAGSAQFIANRFNEGVVDNGNILKIEEGWQEAIRAVLEENLSNLIHFVGFVSTSDPGDGNTVIDGHLWINANVMPTAFPTTGVLVWRDGAWTAAPDYTPSMLELWALASDGHGYYWFNEWNVLDAVPVAPDLSGYVTIAALTSALAAKLGKTENAASASKWAEAITFALSGAITGSVTVDGSGAVDITTIIGNVIQDYIVERWSSPDGSSWYEKYNSKHVKQGGNYYSASGLSLANAITVNLVVPFKNTNYTLLTQAYRLDSAIGYIDNQSFIINKTTSNFVIRVHGDGTVRGVSWGAFGEES
jgi:hypothetical protein